MSDLKCPWAYRNNCAGPVGVHVDEGSSFLVGSQDKVTCCSKHAKLMANGNYSGISSTDRKKERAKKRKRKKAEVINK